MSTLITAYVVQVKQPMMRLLNGKGQGITHSLDATVDELLKGVVLIKKEGRRIAA